MLVTMLQTRKGTEDGFKVEEYAEGESYDICSSLANAFIRSGFAKKAGVPASIKEVGLPDGFESECALFSENLEKLRSAQ